MQDASKLVGDESRPTDEMIAECERLRAQGKLSLIMEDHENGGWCIYTLAQSLEEARANRRAHRLRRALGQ